MGTPEGEFVFDVVAERFTPNGLDDKSDSSFAVEPFEISVIEVRFQEFRSSSDPLGMWASIPTAPPIAEPTRGAIS